MIALTQEKREELKVFLSASIENRCTVYTLAKQRELEALRDQIALASIAAESVAWVFDDDLQDLKNGYIGNLAANNVVPHFDLPINCLYTAPPVAEIKLPDGYALVPIEPTEDMVIAGFESKPSAFNSSTEELEKCEAMSGCEEAAHRAKLCWKAMINSAPDVNGLGE